MCVYVCVCVCEKRGLDVRWTVTRCPTGSRTGSRAGAWAPPPRAGPVPPGVPGGPAGPERAMQQAPCWESAWSAGYTEKGWGLEGGGGNKTAVTMTICTVCRDIAYRDSIGDYVAIVAFMTSGSENISIFKPFMEPT